MMAKVKNDPKNYVKREVKAPSDRRPPPRQPNDRSFFTAPIGPGLYLDFRKPKKPAP